MNSNQSLKRRFHQHARRATEHKIKPLAINYANQSYIHGIKEIYTSHSKAARVFWIGLFVFCVSAAFYEIYQVFRLWRDEGVATKISILTIPIMQYPTVLFCPANWLNKTKLDMIESDQRVLRYLLSILGPINNVELAGFYWPSLEDKRKLDHLIEKTANRTIAQFMLNISMDPEALTCSCCNRNTIERTVTKSGVCFIVELCKTPFQTHSVPSITFSISNDHSLQTTRSNPIHMGFVSLYENRKSIAFSTHDAIFLSPHVPVLIRLSLTHVIRISTRQRPCQDGVFSNVFRCELECYDKIENRQCKNCSIFSILRNDNQYEPCGKEHESSVCTGDQEEVARKEFLECKQSCLPPCSEKIYNVATSSIIPSLGHVQKSNDSVKNVLQAMFHYTAFSETHFEDVAIFNFDTFVSSVGGQAGLWCGASIISLFHLMSYCCCPCVHAINKKSSRRSTGMKRKHGDEEVTELQSAQ